MNVGSLFSGIGGFDLGLERAGFHTSWFCEQDDYCTRVLNRHWPRVPVYPDVTTLTAGEVEPVDVLCGGFPCQDLSLAGKGAGIDGARSGLWSEFARLIGELRPRYVVVENVPALLSRGIWRVLGDLAEIGYDAEWDCLPASAFGAPHRRDRIWIVAYPGGEGLEGHGGAFGDAEEVTDFGSLGVRGEVVADSQGEPERESADEAHPVSVGGGTRDEPLNGCESMGDPESVGCRPRRQGGSTSTGAGERISERPLQNPDSSTVQSWRVGGRIAQAGGSEWWAVEPNMGGGLDGFSAWLDRSDEGRRMIRHAHESYLTYANAEEGDPAENLRVVRDHLRAQDVREPVGGRLGISSEAVLFAYLRELAERCDEGNASLAGKEASGAEVRSLRGYGESPRPPHRPGPGKQRAGEHSDPLQAVSRLLALDAEAAWLAYRRSDACPDLCGGHCPRSPRRSPSA